EGDGHVGFGRIARMNVPDGIDEPLFAVLPLIRVEILVIFIDVAWNHVEIEPFRRFRLAIHEQRQAFRARVAEPFLDGQPIALRLRDFLALLVEKELEIKSFWRGSTKGTA